MMRKRVYKNYKEKKENTFLLINIWVSENKRQNKSPSWLKVTKSLKTI
ncbi:MAG: hypothetical protein RBT49_17165 [Bacteroidales bacterium]|nr:hypothetical protein [Bacteroidales bacterium]